MKINIYYGGRGLIEDPTLYVISKLQAVLEELRVEVRRYNLYEEKSSIATLPSTLKDADGVILAVSVEWFGIGGLMQQFLDMCWLYGDKAKLSTLYMLPVVVATSYGERDGETTLIKAWDTLDGIPISGLCTYVEKSSEFEGNSAYASIIEKKAEMMYRYIGQKSQVLPSSNKVVRDNIMKTKNINLTPQESEQLSKFVSDDSFVKKQKKDIEDLTFMFKQMLGDDSEETKNNNEDEYIRQLKAHFYPENNFSAKYLIILPDKNRTLSVNVNNGKLDCVYTEDKEADVVLKVSEAIMNSIIGGRMTFQKGFMAGEITAKGNFKTLRMLDQIFRFG